MQNSELRYPLRGWFSIVPQAHNNSSFSIHHSAFPRCGEGIKIIPSPDWIRGGIQSIPRFHPGYGLGPSLIGTVTGAPVQPFPVGSSEVVSSGAVLRASCTKVTSSLGIFPGMHVFVIAFYTKNLSYFLHLVNPQFRKNHTRITCFSFHNSGFGFPCGSWHNLEGYVNICNLLPPYLVATPEMPPKYRSLCLHKFQTF